MYKDLSQLSKLNMEQVLYDKERLKYTYYILTWIRINRQTGEQTTSFEVVTDFYSREKKMVLHTCNSYSEAFAVIQDIVQDV